MATRKDNKGRVLQRGEMQRSEDLRYVYSYTDPYGKRRRIYANTLKELREKEDQLKKDQLDGLDIYAAGESDLNFVFDRYISTKTELRRSTYSNYKYMYNKYVRKKLGRKKISEIKYSDVMFFYMDLQKEHLQINTLETIHTILHPTFQLAVRDAIIRTNPSTGVMAELKRKVGKASGIRHALTLEQQRAFINYVNNSQTYFRWAPLFTVMLGTGCRIGETIGLRWEDIDLENRVININHQVVYYTREESESRKAEYAVSLPKTEAGIREIPMLDVVYDAFLKEREYQDEFGYNTTVIDGMSGFIFTNRFCGMQNPQAVNRAIKRIIQTYNAEEVLNAKKERREAVILPNFSCHHLRHTFCTRFCERETNVKIIQTIMGHSDITTTMNIYADATLDTKKEAFGRLSKSLDIF